MTVFDISTDANGFRPEALRRIAIHPTAAAASVVEGVVGVRHEQPASGHTKGDVVIIGGQEFEINYFRTGPGYKATIFHGGALRRGVYARLTHHEGTMLKVEIRTEPGRR